MNISNSVLHERNLTILIEIARVINTKYDLDSILKYLVNILIQESGYDVCSILLREGDILVNKAGYGISQEELKKIRLKTGEGIVGHVAATGDSILIKDTSKDPRYVHFCHDAKYLSEVAVPIMIEKELIGVLNVENKKANSFNEEDLFFLKGVADQAAAAINNAKITESLDQFNKRLLKLYETSKEINASLDVDSILKKIVSDVAESLKCEMVSFLYLKKGYLV
tara:strand:- start:2688 stop:3362 length:675 start_codon:yes stop_codon:yes gene_type:complete